MYSLIEKHGKTRLKSHSRVWIVADSQEFRRNSRRAPRQDIRYFHARSSAITSAGSGHVSARDSRSLLVGVILLSSGAGSELAFRSCFGLRASSSSRDIRLAGSTGNRPVRRQSFGASPFFSPGKHLGNVITGSTVHLVRSLTLKRGVGESHVGFVDVERDQSLDGGDGVERVQVEPSVLQDAPPRFGQGVRERDLRHGQEAFQPSGLDQFIDPCIEVFHSSVGKESWRAVEWGHLTRGVSPSCRCARSHSERMHGCRVVASRGELACGAAAIDGDERVGARSRERRRPCRGVGQEVRASRSEHDGSPSSMPSPYRRDVEGDDIWRSQARPVSRGRTWNTISHGQLDVAGLMNETPESVIVAPTNSGSFHASVIRAAPR